ncbi:hypothetical protein ACFRCG_12540 [Embleya sp. NPDC056575]|uniref:hypothetical protein n=1 Tax=unclassified Embleya TaxID=2699296 RepID=UPI0036ADE9ED
MSYYVQYTDLAERGLSGLSTADRATIKRQIENTIGRDPYGHGSSPIHGNKERRSASLSSAVFEYEVSASVLTITVLRAVPW